MTHKTSDVPVGTDEEDDDRVDLVGLMRIHQAMKEGDSARVLFGFNVLGSIINELADHREHVCSVEIIVSRLLVERSLENDEWLESMIASYEKRLELLTTLRDLAAIRKEVGE